MDRVKRGVVVVSLGCVMALAMGGPTAIAVPPHKHCLLTQQGWVEVGPRVFNQPHLHETAFHQFHANVHVSGVPTTIASITDPTKSCATLPIP